MPLTERLTEFTERDFDAWRLQLQLIANATFPQWTDYNAANFGNLLLELFAHTLDAASYTIDAWHRENWPSTARLRSSQIAHAKRYNYSLPTARAATVDLEFTIADGQARTTDVTIPAGTVITTRDSTNPVTFETGLDAVISAGNIQVDGISAENSEQQDTALFTADGSPDQFFTLPGIPYLDDSATVLVGGTDVYTQVDDFHSSGPTDRHFVVEVDERDRATVFFGDDVNGKAPSGSTEIDYRTGGGEAGNVEANTLTAFVGASTFSDGQGNPVSVIVRNPSAASGGADRMSTAEARIAIPEVLKTVGNRSVTLSDFEINARRVRGVARSMMMTSDQDPSLPENTGKLYIVPVGGGLPSTVLKDLVEATINDDYPPPLTFVFTVEDPVLKIISINATVYLRDGVSETEARDAIESSLDDFFALTTADGVPNTQIDFGYKLRGRSPVPVTNGEVPFSDLFNAVRDAARSDGTLVCRKVDEDVFVPADDVAILDTEFPVLGSIVLYNGDTASPF